MRNAFLTVLVAALMLFSVQPVNAANLIADISLSSQTMTVTVRALATRNLDIHNAWRVVRREAGVGLLHGVAFGLMIGLVAGIWFQDPNIGGVIATAMLINMTAAALAGIAIPLFLDRAGADPAVSSAVFVTAVTDIVGFFAFLGLATWWFAIR